MEWNGGMEWSDDRGPHQFIWYSQAQSIKVFVRTIDNDNSVSVEVNPNDFLTDVIEKAQPKLGLSHVAQNNISIFSNLTDAKTGTNKLQTSTFVNNATATSGQANASFVVVAGDKNGCLFACLIACLLFCLLR